MGEAGCVGPCYHPELCQESAMLGEVELRLPRPHASSSPQAWFHPVLLPKLPERERVWWSLRTLAPGED